MRGSQYKILSIFVLLLSACGQNSNSFSNDETNFGNSSVAGSAQFKAVNLILVQNCSDCHAYSNYSEADWISKGYISPGKPDGSKLFQRLIGSGVPGPQDMPVNGALSSDDIQTIRDWINGI